MNTITSVIELSPDVSITKTETFDVDFARQIANDPNLPKSDKDLLKRYIKNKVRGNRVDVLYKLGKDCKHEFLGRFCALRGIGLQVLPRDIRNAIARQYYWDIDINNAQPTLLIQICEPRGLVCSALKKYRNQREELLTELSNFCDIQRWEAKQKIVSLLFGAGATEFPDFFKNELYPELRNIQRSIWNETQYKFLKDKPNCYGKALANFLQTEERKCLLAMDRSLAKHNRSLDTLIHDGGLVRKLPNEVAFPSSLLREIERDVKDETGYSIVLAVKPMETSFEKEVDENEDYKTKKVEFEMEYFKLMNPPQYIRLKDDTITHLTLTDLIHQQRNLLLENGKKFIDLWIDDPEIRTYQELVFAPKKPVEPTQYNIFDKFEVEAVEGDWSAFRELAELICNKEVAVVECLLKWLAHIIQKPYQKTGVCVVISGDQGVGKDTFFNYFSKILGKNYSYNTSSPENDVFALFKSATERALLVKFEEATFLTNKNNAERLKKIITSEKETYETKGVKSVVLDDYRNFVMTTNQHTPVLIEDGDRRFMLIKASDEKKGDNEFWDYIHTELSKPSVQSAFHHYLLNLDISNFNPQRDRIKTEFYNDVKQSFIPQYARFLQGEVEKYYAFNEEIDSSKFPSYTNKRMCEIINDKSKYEITEIKLGLELRPLVNTGVIEKVRCNVGFKYNLIIPKIEETLKMKGWWLNF